MTQISMHQVEQLAYNLSKSRAILTTRMATLEEQMSWVKNKRIRGIKSALADVTAKQSELKDTIEAAPELFDKPRTATFHGIRVGMQKGKGKIDFDAEDQVIKRIKKHLGDRADLLIAVSEKLVKKALEQLTVEDLKKIGARVIDAEDQVFIKPADSAVDKLVNALMKEMEKLDEDAA